MREGAWCLLGLGPSAYALGELTYVASTALSVSLLRIKWPIHSRSTLANRRRSSTC